MFLFLFMFCERLAGLYVLTQGGQQGQKRPVSGVRCHVSGGPFLWSETRSLSQHHWAEHSRHQWAAGTWSLDEGLSLGTARFCFCKLNS